MHLARLKEDGFYVFKNMFGLTGLNQINEEIGSIYDSYRKYDPISLRTEYRKTLEGFFALDRLDPVLDLSVALRQLVAKELKPILESAFSSQITVFKCKHILKEPQTTGYTLHQDYLYWTWMNMPASSLYSFIIPLAPFDPLSGPIKFYRGANKHLIDAQPHNAGGDLKSNQFEGFEVVIPRAELGDGLVFDSLAPHESDANCSLSSRPLVILSFALGDFPDLYRKYWKYEMQRRTSSLQSGVGAECFRGIEERLFV